MRKVELTMNENEKYEVIKKLVDSKGNKHKASVKLGCTIRTINRLIKVYEEKGKAGFSHGNHKHKPVSTISSETKDEIITLYENKYFGCNLRHFTELLYRFEKIHVSESTIRSILHDADILSPKAHKATKKALKEKLMAKKQNVKSKKKARELQEKILNACEVHPRRERCAYFGEMIQMDASVHLWFGEKKATLHAAIDDSTGMIVGAYFDEQETLKGYYNVFHQILKTYGIPYMFYTDRRTIFDYKKNNKNDMNRVGRTFSSLSHHGACRSALRGSIQIII